MKNQTEDAKSGKSPNNPSDACDTQRSIFSMKRTENIILLKSKFEIKQFILFKRL